MTNKKSTKKSNNESNNELGRVVKRLDALVLSIFIIGVLCVMALFGYILFAEFFSKA